MALTDEQTLYNQSLGLIGEYEVTESDTTSKQAVACARFYAKARDEVLVSHLWNEAMVRKMILREAVAPLFKYDYSYEKPSDCLRVISIGDDTAEWQVEGNYINTDLIIDAEDWAEGEYYVAGQYISRNNLTYLCNTSHQSAIAWQTGKTYAVNDRVISSSTYYYCAIAHTSGTFATDLAAVKWVATTDDDPDTNTTLWTTQGGNYGVIHLLYVKQLTTITEFSPRLYDAIAMKLAIKIVSSLTGDPKHKKALLDEYEILTMPQARSIDAMQGTPRQIFISKWLRSRQ